MYKDGHICYFRVHVTGEPLAFGPRGILCMLEVAYVMVWVNESGFRGSIHEAARAFRVVSE